MTIKLVIYNDDLKKEIHPTYPKDNWLGLMDSINQSLGGFMKYELLKWGYYGTQGTNIKTSWRVVQRNELGEIVQVLRSATLKRDAIRALNKLNETI